MLHSVPGFEEGRLSQLTSIAGRGYRADSHLFLTLPAVLMLVSVAACAWRSASGMLATLVALSGICVLAALFGLNLLVRTFRELFRGGSEPGSDAPISGS